jgi:uncharacterized protein HemX
MNGNGNSEKLANWLKALWPILVAVVLITGVFYTLQAQVSQHDLAIRELKEDRKSEFRLTEREYNGLIRRLDSIEEKLDKTNDKLDRRERRTVNQ